MSEAVEDTQYASKKAGEIFNELAKEHSHEVMMEIQNELYGYIQRHIEQKIDQKQAEIKLLEMEVANMQELIDQ